MTDSNSKYNDLPRPESIDFFEKGTVAHNVVTSLEKVNSQYYHIKRDGKSELQVYLTNLYIVGIADVHEIITEFPEVDCIVTISSWNSYSQEAKAFCTTRKIGLFKYSEYYGALYYDDEKFYSYEPPEKND